MTPDNGLRGVADAFRFYLQISGFRNSKIPKVKALLDIAWQVLDAITPTHILYTALLSPIYSTLGTHMITRLLHLKSHYRGD